MIPHVEYVRFDNPSDAVSFMKNRTGKATFLAGGTDVMVRMRNGKVKTGCLVDISGARTLKGIAQFDGGTEIGALTTIDEIRLSQALAKDFPALLQASNTFAAWQVRNLATLGGNLCNASPAADMGPPLLVYDAEIEAMGPNGRRRMIQIDRFFKGPGQTALREGELMTRIRVPMKAGGSAFLKLGRRRANTLAVVSVAVRLVTEGGQVTDARVALGSVAPTPIRATSVERFLKGKAVDRRTFAAASALVSRDIHPINDVRSSAAYRQSMAVYITAKSLETATLARGASS